MRLFIFGYGYAAKAILAHMLPRPERIWATTRDRQKAAEMKRDGIEAIRFPDPDVDVELAGAIAQATHILHSIAPGPQGDPVWMTHRDQIAASELKAIAYLSTIGVYGDHQGALVNETASCRPASNRSIWRMQAEQDWQGLADRSGIPLSTMRLAGIYGPGRGPQEKIKTGMARRIVKPGQVFNRIHVEDIAQCTCAALLGNAAGIFNVADDEPAPPQDVIAYAANLMGVQPPPEIEFDKADLSPMAESFYAECKRICNTKVKLELDVEMAYPTYREGMAAIIGAV